MVWKMRNKFIVVVIASILVISGVFLLSEAQKQNSIEIGSILILTGEGSNWGEAAKNGINLAIEDINKEGGVNGRLLKADHQDDRSDPKQSVNSFNQLRQEGINIIIGTSWSHTGLPLVDMADEQKVLMISPSLGVKEFNEASPYLFNTWPHDFILSRALADYVYSKGVRKVAMIGAQQVWVKDQTINFKQRFEELGGEVVMLVEPDPSDKTPYTDALKIKEISGEIDAIISTTDGILVGTLVAKRVRELGINKPIYSITVDQDIITASEGAYEGMEYLTSLTPSEEFKERYEEKYGIPIDISADSAYDAVMLISKAMKETGSEDPIILQEYLNDLKEYQGMSGNLVFDGKGGVTKEFVTMKVENGTAFRIS